MQIFCSSRFIGNVISQSSYVRLFIEKSLYIQMNIFGLAYTGNVHQLITRIRCFLPN